MGYEPMYTDDEIQSYVPEGREVSELSDWEREEIEHQYERDKYLDDEYYKTDDDDDEGTND